MKEIYHIDELLLEDRESKLVYGKIIQENAEQLLGYVNNIFELSRLESGKIQYEQEEVDAIGACRQLVDFVNSQESGKTKITLQTAFERQIVRTDPKWCTSLMRGLLASWEDSEHSIRVCIERDEAASLLIFCVVGTLLAQEIAQEKKILIRNEINAHFIRYLCGTYTVSADVEG